MDRRPGKRLSPARSFAVGALAVLLVFAAAVPLVMFFVWDSGSRDMVVVAFDARSGEPALDRALRAELISQLRGTNGIRILSDIQLALQPPPGGVTGGRRTTHNSVCGATGADYVFSSRMSREESHYLVGIEVRSCSSGGNLVAERLQVASREQLPEAVHWLASVAKRLAS